MMRGGARSVLSHLSQSRPTPSRLSTVSSRFVHYLQSSGRCSRAAAVSHSDSNSTNRGALLPHCFQSPLSLNKNARSLATQASETHARPTLHVLPANTASYEVFLGPTALNKLWLRDRCQCDECVHPETKQRLFDTFSLSQKNLTITQCTHDRESHTLHVTWQDGHKSEYDAQAVESSFNTAAKYSIIQGETPISWWDQSQLKDADYVEVMQSQDGLRQLMRTVREHGYAFVENCPETPEDTQALLDRIGPIRNTHYGGFYDFTSDLSSKDTAYTSIALDAHTDTTYFSEPARLQLFHLLSHTQGSGGETQLVDSFRAAEQLKQQDPKAFEILATVPLSAHASGNDGISIQPLEAFTTLKIDPISQKLTQVRWNVSDRGTFLADPSAIAAWYDAARKFNDILRTEDSAWRVETKLRPGKPVIIDNWRVLHGRSAFTGKRRMSGGYISNDDFISCFKMTNLGKEAVVGAQVF